MASHWPTAPPMEMPQKANLGSFELVREGKHVLPELIERVITSRYCRCAMAARVIAEDLKVIEQVRHLRRPHAKIAAKGM